MNVLKGRINCEFTTAKKRNRMSEYASVDHLPIATATTTGFRLCRMSSLSYLV